MKINREELKAKGWSEQEIEKVLRIIRESDENKAFHISFLEKFLFWSLLLLSITGIFAINIYILPLLIIFNNFVDILVLLLLGICLGSFISFILNDLEWLGFKHHLLTLSLLPIISVLTLFFTTKTINLELPFSQTFSLGLIFSLGLLFPYFVFLLIKKNKNDFIKKINKNNSKR